MEQDRQGLYLTASPGETWQSPGFQAGLYALLAQRTGRYTMGEHSSVPVELAEELFRSVCFLVGTALELGPPSPRDALPQALYPQGLALVRGLLPSTRRLWERLRVSVQNFGNLALGDTLENIGAFFTRYDPDFFAHQIPCDIDYPLADPVPDRLAGVRYLNAYLTRLRVEDRFVRAFGPQQVEQVLALYVPDYRVQLINLFEPVFAGAAARALLGRDPAPLLLDRGELAALAPLLERAGPGGTAASLEAAAAKLSEQLALTLPGEAEYLCRCAALLAPRAWHALGSGELAGVFMVSSRGVF